MAAEAITPSPVANRQTSRPVSARSAYPAPSRLPKTTIPSATTGLEVLQAPFGIAKVHPPARKSAPDRSAVAESWVGRRPCAGQSSARAGADDPNDTNEDSKKATAAAELPEGPIDACLCGIETQVFHRRQGQDLKRSDSGHRAAPCIAPRGDTRTRIPSVGMKRRRRGPAHQDGAHQDAGAPAVADSRMDPMQEAEAVLTRIPEATLEALQERFPEGWKTVG